MARTIRHQPSEDRKALIQRGGARGFHGGGKRQRNRVERKAARLNLRKELVA